MQRSELLATIEHICDIELDTLERDDLADIVTATARVRGWLDATELRCTRRARTLADAGRAEPAPSLIARKGNRSNRDADQVDRRDKVAEAMPSFEDGLDEGTVSAGHLDAIANATRNASPEVRAAFAAHETELVALAAGDSIEVFARRCRALVAELTTELTGNDATELDRQRAASKIRQWVDAHDGLHHTHIALDPLRHEILWNAINRHLRQRQRRDGTARTPWNQMQVDALIDAVQNGNTDNQPPRRPATPPTAAPPDAAPTATTPKASPPAPAAAPSGPAAASPTNAPTTSRAPAPTDPAEPASDTRPPSPAADIARDLADAVDRSIRNHPRPAEPAPHNPDPTPHPWADTHNDTAPDSAPGDYTDGDHTDGDHDGDQVDDHDGDHDGDQVDGDQPDDRLEPGDDIDGDIDDDEVLRRIEQRVPEISVLMDLSVLTDWLNAHGICETEDGNPLPVSTVRRLCCDAEIIPIILGANGIPLDLGRTARTVNRTQRRALRAMHRTCAHPDCNTPFSHTKIHHIRWWTRDHGPTDIDNLLPLCERHHHLVHEGGWNLTMTPNRIATWTRPDGTTHHQGPTIDRRPPPPTTDHHPPESRSSGSVGSDAAAVIALRNAGSARSRSSVRVITTAGSRITRPSRSPWPDSAVR